MGWLETLFIIGGLLLVVNYADGNTFQTKGGPQEGHDEAMLEIIYDTLSELQLELKKEDRLREVASLLRVDIKLDDLNRKIDDLASQESSSRLEERGHGQYDERVKSIEDTVKELQEVFTQIDKKMTKFEQQERQSTDDINNKLRKMMNIITSVYEINKDVRSQLDPANAPQQVERSRPGPDMITFLLENLQEIERKFKEELSILKVDVKNDLNYLKTMAASISTQCASPPAPSGTADYFDFQGSTLVQSRLQPASSSIEQRQESNQPGHPVNVFQDFEVSLNRSQRQLKEDLANSLQSIDVKLSDISSYVATCDRQGRRADESNLDDVPRHLQDLNPGGNRRDPQGTTFRTCSNASHLLLPKSCAELLNGGANCDGAYVIYPMGAKAVRVFCDMSEGGWTVIMRRGDYGRLRHSFQQNWESYKMGFGDVAGEYWVGNENLQLMSNQDVLELQVDLEARDGARTSFSYTRFSVGSEGANYRLRLGSPTEGSEARLATYFRHHSAHPFSTYDRNNRRGGCSVPGQTGGWWHLCHNQYVRLTEPQMSWYNWNSDVKSAVLKVRPVAVH